jgi:hypothetical protein
MRESSYLDPRACPRRELRRRSIITGAARQSLGRRYGSAGNLRALAEMAEASGGGITDPPQAVGDGPDWEGNRILDLAAAVGAFLIISADADLTSMSPWRARPIIEPPQFASMIDASRRARRRRH